MSRATERTAPAIDCPGCGERSWQERDPGDRTFTLLRCRTCGCEAMVLARPDPAALYEGYYATAGARRASGVLDRVWRAIRRAKAARILRALPVRPRVLDVGCERGELLHELRARGADVFGTQISATAAEYARHHFGIEVFVGDLADAPLAPASFDAVLMINVLEHLPDPERYVSLVAGLLRPGGTFWIELPDPESFTARVAGKRWLHADPLHHFWAFSERGLTALLGRHGLTVADTDQWSWEHGPIGCVQSWLNLLFRRPRDRDLLFGVIVGGLRRDRLAMQALHLGLAGLLAVPACVVGACESAAGKGQLMRMRAVKRSS